MDLMRRRRGCSTFQDIINRVLILTLNFALVIQIMNENSSVEKQSQNLENIQRKG
jgi:uncharacterized PurR-regulated membrane protein YhhQ (DUF165 family)